MAGRFQPRQKIDAKRIDSLGETVCNDGSLCWVSQRVLVFGSDSREERSYRSAFVIRDEDASACVIPATSKQASRWFPVGLENCSGLKRASYLTKGVEVIDKSQLGQLICTLTPFCQLGLSGWLRENMGITADGIDKRDSSLRNLLGKDG
jgi:hypothetical protein